jgi:hypothetical protein
VPQLEDTLAPLHLVMSVLRTLTRTLLLFVDSCAFFLLFRDGTNEDGMEGGVHRGMGVIERQEGSR